MDYIVYVYYNISFLFICNFDLFYIGYSKIKNVYFFVNWIRLGCCVLKKNVFYKYCINVDIEKKENIYVNGFLNIKKS